MNDINKYANPFFKEGNKKEMCLLIHGFAGSPSEMKPLGQYLYNKGYGVSIPLLSGHGTTPEDMNLTSWIDWYVSVEDEYLRILKKYPKIKIIPIGLSMGGTLALHLAYNYNFKGIITLCPGLYLNSRKVYFLPLLKYFKKYEYKNITGDSKKIKNKNINKQFFYNKIPIKSVNSLLALIRKVRKEITYINAPFLIIQSKNDRTVNPNKARKIYNNISSQIKKIIWLEKSGHIVTLGSESNLVFKEIYRFLNNIEQL